MHRDEVALREQRIEFDALRAEFGVRFRPVDLLGVEHLHAPAVVEAFRGREADAAHADDAERAAGEVLAEPAERFPGQPAPGFASVALSVSRARPRA